MRLRMWGTRGSVPSPGPDTIRYGGNTSCVGLELNDDEWLILDAGTGARSLGRRFSTSTKRINILLTHLHMDHVQGLGFFAPLFFADTEVHIWGPSEPGHSLASELEKYLSPPLFPEGLKGIPNVHLHELPVEPFKVGSATVEAHAVRHRGAAVGYRVESNGHSLAYVPDHEPELTGPIDKCPPEWVSGYRLAQGVDLLIHDAQYADEEYARHRGWGHSAISHTIDFAKLAGARRLLLFHHDPGHTDEECDLLLSEAKRLWLPCGESDDVASAQEGAEIDLDEWLAGSPPVEVAGAERKA